MKLYIILGMSGLMFEYVSVYVCLYICYLSLNEITHSQNVIYFAFIKT